MSALGHKRTLADYSITSSPGGKKREWHGVDGAIGLSTRLAGERIFRYEVWTFRLLRHCPQIYNRIMPPGIMPATILRHAYGIYRSAAMLAGMQLDLFTPLKNGPMSAATLANALSLRADKLRPLLYALVDAELLTLVEDDHFANTPEAEVYLVRGHDMYLGSAHELYSDLWTAALAAGQSIRAGRPKAKHDFTAMSDEELGAFFRGLHAGALATGRQLATTYDFGPLRNLLDVGGGSGGVSIAPARTVATLERRSSNCRGSHRWRSHGA